jgi:hypothetical protein
VDKVVGRLQKSRPLRLAFFIPCQQLPPPQLAFEPQAFGNWSVQINPFYAPVLVPSRRLYASATVRRERPHAQHQKRDGKNYEAYGFTPNGWLAVP